MQNFLKRVALATLLVLSCLLPMTAGATDRVIHPYGANPQSSWFNWMQRLQRLGDGTTLAMIFGSTTGFTYNLAVNPASGLYVTVGPQNANSLGAVYQYLPEEATPYGGPGVTALPTDATQVYLQGLISTTSPTIGPLTAPVTTGQSINYLIECQVQTVDNGSQSVTFVTSSGVQSTGTTNEFRRDEAACQYKAGTAASTGTQTTPTTDTGWISVAVIPIAYGATSIAGSSVTPTRSTQFNSSKIYDPSGNPLGVTAHSVNIPVVLSSSQVTCGPMVSYYCATVTLANGAIFTSPLSFACSGGFTTTGGENGVTAFANYGGSFQYVSSVSDNVYIVWNNAISPVTTIYIGGTSGAFAGNRFQITCTGY